MSAGDDPLCRPYRLQGDIRSSGSALGLVQALPFLAVVINIPLNYALIWGVGPLPMLGLTGRRHRLSWWPRPIGAGGCLGLLAEGPLDATASVAPDIEWRSEIASVAREGAPLGLMYIAETGAMAVATLMIGTFGAVALAGNQVAMSVGGLLYMVPLGIAGAVAIRVAQERGAGNLDALRPITWAALGMGTLWLAGAAAVLGLHGATIAAWITNEPEVIAVAATIFFVFAFSQVMDGVQSTMTGALRGLSDTGFPALVSMLAYWVLGLPLGWVLAHSGWYGAVRDLGRLS
jgi:multidrug resistance protein, MATE family